MKVTKETYKDVEMSKIYYENSINTLKDEILKITLFRDRLKQLIDIIDDYEINDTNRELLEECSIKLNKIFQVQNNLSRMLILLFCFFFSFFQVFFDGAYI